MNPHERITHIGGPLSNGKTYRITQQEAIQAIEDDKWAFYVSKGGHTVDVIVATHNKNKYLKTESDGEQPNNLLSLPECA